MAVLQQSFLPKITASFTLFYIEGTYAFIPRRVNEVFLINDERYNATKDFIFDARFVVFPLFVYFFSPYAHLSIQICVFRKQ